MKRKRDVVFVWRAGALGDTVVLLPALSSLRMAYPSSHIVLAGTPQFCEPALWSDLVDEVLDASSARWAPIHAGAAPPSSDLFERIHTAIAWSAAHDAIAAGLNGAGVPHVITAPALPPGRQLAWRYYMDTLAPLGIQHTGEATRIHPPADAIAATENVWLNLVGDPHTPVIIMHPGTGSPLKEWPLNNYVELTRLLRAKGYAVLWSCGPGDHRHRETLQSMGEEAYLIPKLELREASALIHRAALVVSADCGVAHLSTALGVPTITLFGPSDHKVWAPSGGRSLVLRLNIPCSPCASIARACPTRICLRALSVHVVERVVHAWLSQRHTSLVSEYSAESPRYAPPQECRAPVSAPKPPNFLQVASWDSDRSWELRGLTEQE